MRRSVRAIIINDNHLLVMHRNKFGNEYDTLPGGAIEIGETEVQALYRELEEETTVKFDDPRLIYIEHAGEMYGDQYIFLCNYISGDPKLHIESDEYQINQFGKNLYEPRWLNLKDLSVSPFLSSNLKEAILQSILNGWPENTLEITS